MTRKQQLIEIIADQVIGRLYEQTSEMENEYHNFEIEQAIESGVATKHDSITNDFTQEDSDAIDLKDLTDRYIKIYKDELEGQDLYDYTTFIEDLDTEEFLNPSPEYITERFLEKQQE
jgi:hypothetical protein